MLLAARANGLHCFLERKNQQVNQEPQRRPFIGCSVLTVKTLQLLLIADDVCSATFSKSIYCPQKVGD